MVAFFRKFAGLSAQSRVQLLLSELTDPSLGLKASDPSPASCLPAEDGFVLLQENVPLFSLFFL